MNEIYLVDAVFLAKRPIRSLAEFHGARWSAWLRYACQRCGLPLDSIILGLMPLRNGQNPIEAGEALALRLAARDPDRPGGAWGRARHYGAPRRIFGPVPGITDLAGSGRRQKASTCQQSAISSKIQPL